MFYLFAHLLLEVHVNVKCIYFVMIDAIKIQSAHRATLVLLILNHYIEAIETAVVTAFVESNWLDHEDHAYWTISIIFYAAFYLLSSLFIGNYNIMPAFKFCRLLFPGIEVINWIYLLV